jgi:gamma-glutamyltranspeptidase / glutathione hydrolase / leukotriene-C4 hydrolase
MHVKIIEIYVLKNRVKWDEPMTATFRGGETLYTVPPPGSGALLALILNVLDEYHFDNKSISSTENTIHTFHRITEAFKFATAHRGELGDTAYVSIKEVRVLLQFNSFLFLQK